MSNKHKTPSREEILENVLLILEGQDEEIAVPQVEAYVRMHLGMSYDKSDFIAANRIVATKRDRGLYTK